MQIVLFLIGSAAPILLLVGGALAFHGLKTTAKLALQFALLVASAPFGAWIIGKALPLLPRAHLHSDNPGQGVIYIFLLPIWLLCLMWWLVWVAIAACKAGDGRRSPRL